MDNAKCACCDAPLYFRWTDTHGVAICCNCGLPYVVYHYDEDKKRIDKPPQPIPTDVGLNLAKQYFAATGNKVFPASHSFFLGDRPSYCGATQREQKEFYDWADTHKEEYDPQESPNEH